MDAYRRAAEVVAARLRDDPNILAVALFGSAGTERVHEQSDVDLYVIEQGDEKVWKAVYLRQAGLMVHLQYLSRAQFGEACSRLGGSPLHRALASCSVLWARDDAVVRLFQERRHLPEPDRALRLLEAAGNLCHSLYLSRPVPAGRPPLPAMARVLEHLARAILFSAGVIPGPEPVAEAVGLDEAFARAVAALEAEGTAAAVLALAAASLEANLGEWCRPLTGLLAARGSPASMEEIEESPPLDQLRCDLEKLVFLLARRGIIRETYRPFRPTLSTEPLLAEVAYVLPPTDGTGGGE